MSTMPPILSIPYRLHLIDELLKSNSHKYEHKKVCLIFSSLDTSKFLNQLKSYTKINKCRHLVWFAISLYNQ